MLVWLCWKASTWPAACTARTRLVAIGWPRPTRASSARCHISLMGLPMAWEIFAASKAQSKNRRRPNEPPPCTACTVTASRARPSSSAIRCWATIGDFKPAQIVARSARTSAIAELVSIAELLRK